MSKSKVHYQYGIKDFHRMYAKRGGEIPYKNYKGFIRDFFIAIMDEVIEKRWTFFIPHKLGFVLVKSYKKSVFSAPRDYAAYKETGKKIKFTNNHSYQRVYTFRWITNLINFKNKSFYEFKPIFTAKKALSKHIIKASKDPKIKLLS